jgi:hypothetical protein
MNKNSKKKLLVQLLKDIAQIQYEAELLKNKNVAKGLKYLLENLIKETIDFQTLIYYIDSAMRKSKSKSSKVLWISVYLKVKNYFENIK